MYHGTPDRTWKLNDMEGLRGTRMRSTDELACYGMASDTLLTDM